MNESIPSRTQPPHAARNPRRWFRVRGTSIIPQLFRQWTISWNPSTNCLRVSFIRIAKLPPQSWLLVKHYKQSGQEKEDSRLNQNRPGHKENCFTQQYRHHCHIHRIADITIEPADNQMFRWIDWRNCSPARRKEIPNAPEQCRCSDGDQRKT